MKLTDEQKEVVLTIGQNVLVNASAGSGKTQSFTTRIAYMIQEKDVSPYNMLAITFTKKASLEMKKRLAKMIGKDKAKKIPMGTFHSISYRILQLLDSDFARLKIAPQWWVYSTMSSICKPANDKNRKGLNLMIKAGELASFISYQKSNMIMSTDDVLIDDNVDYVAGVSRSDLQEAYRLYELLKSSSRQIDFDDMLLYMYNKLVTDEKFRQKLSEQYKYIMIDEFQDTAKIVLEIVKLINKDNVFVVGDFRQSIYSFINADVNNILNFKDDFDNVKLIELNKNFRSTQNIVELSNAIIDNSPIEKYKQFKHSESVGEIGKPIPFSLCTDETEQFNFIIDEIKSLSEKGTDYKEMAVLVRTNAQTALLETMLADRDIPYEVSKSMSFFDRREVLDILSYARIAMDLKDDASFRRIYNSPNRYLSQQSLEDLDQFASEREMSLYQAVKVTPQNSDWKFKKNIDGLLKIIEDLKYQIESNLNAGRVLRNAIKLSKYKQYINDTTSAASMISEKNESIDKLCEIASKFPSVKALMAHIGTIKEKQAKSKGKNSVQISTIHSAKGLEWDTVFVPNCVEGSMPHSMNNNIEEERRLFYVACSRAKTKLYLSWHFYDGDMEKTDVSRFVGEMLGGDTVKSMNRELFGGHRVVTKDISYVKEEALQ